MSDSDDQVTKKKQKVIDDQSAGCSKQKLQYIPGIKMCAQRLLYVTQSIDSNQRTQTTQKIGDIIIETNNDQDTSNSRQSVRVRKDNKERNRLYRERHREEINQRRRDNRQRKKNTNQIQQLALNLNVTQKLLALSYNRSNIQNKNKIEQITHATSNNQISSNSHTQRQQRYYERHKEEINKRKRDNRLKLNTSKLIPATAAERNRNYRERNRQRINERRRDSRLLQLNVQQVHTECNINNIDAIKQITKATRNSQQNFNSSNDNIIQEIAQNYTTLQQSTEKNRGSPSSPIKTAATSFFIDHSVMDFSNFTQDSTQGLPVKQEYEPTNEDNYNLQIKHENEDIPDADNPFQNLQIAIKHETVTEKDPQSIEITLEKSQITDPDVRMTYTSFKTELNDPNVRKEITIINVKNETTESILPNDDGEINVKVNEEVTVKEEMDNVVDYNYLSFDDSMDSSGAAALSQVKACLSDDVRIKTEIEF